MNDTVDVLGDSDDVCSGYSDDDTEIQAIMESIVQPVEATEDGQNMTQRNDVVFASPVTDAVYSECRNNTGDETDVNNTCANDAIDEQIACSLGDFNAEVSNACILQFPNKDGYPDVPVDVVFDYGEPKTNSGDVNQKTNQNTEESFQVCIFLDGVHNGDSENNAADNDLYVIEVTADESDDHEENRELKHGMNINIDGDYTMCKFNKDVDKKTDMNNDNKKIVIDTRVTGSTSKGIDATCGNKEAVEDIDPWQLPEVTVDVKPWILLSKCEKTRLVLWHYIGKCLLLLVCLYFFVCSLDLISNAFRLLGGKTAGSVFQNSAILGNPVAGLMIGVLVTVLLQSSSTTTGIAISLVVSGVMTVHEVIPVVMGANIGTSITNTLVSLGQITRRSDFRRAFAGATVHDVFNGLSVLVLLPIEVATGYLFWLTKAVVDAMSFPTQGAGTKRQQFLKTITKPFTNLIIKIDKRVLADMAAGKEGAGDRSIIRHCCRTGLVPTRMWNITGQDNITIWGHNNTCVQKCTFLFESVSSHWSDTTVGAVLLVLTLVVLCACFVTLVRTIYSMLRGRFLIVMKKFINSDFPGCLSFLTGYLAIAVGTGTTMIVQSSSVVTSSLTPLVGMGLISIERMYPLTLGANLGTTFTAVIIALSQSAEDMPVAFQVALCHMFFNISGVLIFYPIPRMRIPIKLSKFLGNMTAKYRWFGIVYMVAIFIVFPTVIFVLSTISWIALVAFAAPCACVATAVFTVNILQTQKPELLPKLLRSWDFLPPCLMSLEPYDDIITRVMTSCRCTKEDSVEVACDAKLTSGGL